MIAIIAPMQEELEEYLKNIPHLVHSDLLNTISYKGEWKGRPLIVVKSGVGKVNAAMATQYLISHFPLSAVISQGVAGAVHPALNIGDIVLGESHVQHDLNVTALGFRKGEIPYSAVHDFPGDPVLLEKAKKACEKLGFSYMAGRIISGDQFISDSETIRQLSREFSAHAVDMEMAAIAQVCHINRMPFLSAKAISDRADRMAHTDFPKFLQSSAKKSFQLVEELLSSL